MKISFAKIIFAGFMLFVAHTTSAHVLKVDGTVGAVLHVDPNDSPVAGERASIYFDLKDSAGTFSIDQCDCKVTVSKAGEQIFEKKMTSMAAVPYTFPDRALYIVSFVGAPKNEGTFAPFTLAYDIRVETVSDNQNQTNGAKSNDNKNFFGRHLSHIILFGAAIIFAMITIIRDSLRRKVQ
jgi:hypothetical protein